MATEIDIRSNEKVKLLDLIGEGEIEGFAEDPLKSVYLDDVPIMSPKGELNINGVDIKLRTGTTQQSTITGYSAAINVDQVSQDVNKGWCESGKTCPNPDAWAIAPNAPEYIILEPNTDSIIVTLEFDGLFVSGRTDLNSNKVRFKIEYKKYDTVDWIPIPYINLHRLYGSYILDDLQTPAKVGETTTLDGYDDSNFGAEITIRWDRTILEDLDGDFTYNGSYAKVAIYSRIQGQGWNAEPDEVLNITTENAYSYIGDTFTHSVSDKSNFVYYPAYLYKDDREIYQYKAEFLNSDDTGGTYDNEETSIIIYATTEKYIDDTTEDVGDEGIRIKGTATSAFKQDFRFDLNDCTEVDFPLTVKVTRLSDDEEERLENNTDDDTGLERKGTFKWASISKIVDQKFTYPNSALIGLSFSSETYDKIPKRSYDMKLLKVKIPTNYDPITRVYDGFWAGSFKTEWTNNPAWCLYDLMTNERYGIGQYTADTDELDSANRYPSVDKWALYEVSKFCDELVPTAYGTKGVEPRFTCNTYITQQEEAFTLLRNLASIFRGMLYWMNNKLTTVYDHPTETVDIVFSNSNVENGMFTYSGSSKETRYNTVYVSWSDPSMRYENAIEYVENTEDIAQRGVVSTDLIALGCTSRGQAYRAGKWLLYAEQETVVFTTSIDNMMCKPGDLIEIYDKFRANVRFSGRVFKFENDGLIIDNELDLLEDVEYTLRLVSNFSNVITLPDGSTEDTNTPKLIEFPINISNVRGTKVYIDTDINGNPFDIADYPESTIWTVLQDELQPQIFRVISVMENASDKYEINALHFNQTKLDFIEENIPLTIPTYRRVGYDINVGNIAINEALKVSGNTVINQITVSWDLKPNVNILEFIVEYRYGINNINEGTWLYLGKTKDSEILIDVAPQGYYQARISVVLTAGSIIPPAESDIRYMLGKSLPPRNINNFNYVEKENGIRLTWDSVPDLDLAYYNIKNGNKDTNDTWDTETNYDYGEVDNNYYDVLSYEGNRFFIKAVDTSGNVSVLDSSVDIYIGLPKIESFSGSFTQFGYLLDWTNIRGSYPIDCIEIRQSGVDFDSSERIVKTISDNFTITNFSTWSSNNIKFFARIYDTSGSYAEVVYEQPIAQNYLSNIKFTITYDIIVLSWTNNNLGFDISKVEIREGQDYDTAVYRGTSSTDTISLINNQNAEGTIFWLTPLDISGVEGKRTKISVPNSWLTDTGVEIYSLDLSSTDFQDIMSQTYPPAYDWFQSDKPYTIYTHNYLLGPIASPEFYLGFYVPADEQINDSWTDHFVDSGFTNMADHITYNPSKAWYNTLTETPYYYESTTAYAKFLTSITFDTPKDPGFILELALDYEFISSAEAITGYPIIVIYCRFFDAANTVVYTGSYSANTNKNGEWWLLLQHVHSDASGTLGLSVSAPYNIFPNYNDGNIYNFNADTGVVDTSIGSFTDQEQIHRVEFYMQTVSRQLDIIPMPPLIDIDMQDSTLWESVNSASISEGTYYHWQNGDIPSLDITNTVASGGAALKAPALSVDVGSSDLIRIEFSIGSYYSNVAGTRYAYIGSTKGASDIAVVSSTLDYADEAGFQFVLSVTNYTGPLYVTLINSTNTSEVCKYFGGVIAKQLPDISLFSNGYFDTNVDDWSLTNGTLTHDNTLKAAKIVANGSTAMVISCDTPLFTNISVSAEQDFRFAVQGYYRREQAIGGAPRAYITDTTGTELDYEDISYVMSGTGEFKKFSCSFSISDYTGNVYFNIDINSPTAGYIFYIDNIYTLTNEEYLNIPPVATADFLKLNNATIKLTNPDNIVLTV